MGNIIDMQERMMHLVSEVICVKCCYRWVSVRLVITLLKEIECPGCGNVGFVIETGEVMDDECEEG